MWTGDNVWKAVKSFNRCSADKGETAFIKANKRVCDKLPVAYILSVTVPSMDFVKPKYSLSVIILGNI